ncbi:YkoF family thiamine/hydroxymethylpyrimidine-binding protein [Herbivorax sp. ANBcel31]|uniref:YkoF family thiamine/hydroxymethylpyrimidine-binding protein n=1 Tax=Herbivorax sp. ANBcel31 TaxID=3069754 RepID=UPI0027B12C79|nr:YkoF family thiamine/hydroxymethylpyrimidine-binding protein [Herbivorax sp. ANBcel31]MDQ2085184.1 YkoF family thiamine/hydroxymethylpyrimidine-binding protein [Herbivorax sp. ANBcel31]
MISAEVAVYPLKTKNASNIINKSINMLNGSNVEYSVNSINTVITGLKEDVFQNLQKMFNEAEEKGGEINMVVTISNSN